MAEDLYDILGVSRDASTDDIKSAYRRLAREYHPDQNREDPDAEEKFKKIAAAYEVLGDDEKRQAYDRFGSTKGFGGGPGGFGGAGGFAGAQAAGFEDLFDILGSVFGGAAPGGGRRRGAAKGADFRIDLKIDLEEAASGVDREIEVPAYDTCSTCGGNGAKPGTTPKVCDMCNGTGQARTQQGFFVMARPCPKCGATGKHIPQKCSDCGGDGYVETTTQLKVEVPPGVRDGQKLRWEGKGAPGAKGGPPGDLYVVIRLRDHPLFEREGQDLHCTESRSASLRPRYSGGKVDVPTLDGKVVMTVPAGTQSGKVLRLRKKGFPSLSGSGRGDQLVTLVVETPVNLNDRQRELFEELAELNDEEVHPEKKGFFQRMKELFE